jgi:hypothetical protein
MPTDHRSNELTEENWREIDELIFASRKVLAIKTIHEATKCSLGEALKAMCARYDRLRETSPERFDLDHDAYWDGFES